MIQTIKNFLSKISKNIFKNKKIVLPVLLVFVLAGIIFPQTTFAAWYNPFSWISSAADAIINGMMYDIGIVPLYLTAIISDIAQILLKAATAQVSATKYTDNIVVNAGWPIMRDFANMFIVLGFVVIAISTILRFRDYEAKKLLPKLIIAALLINFSLVICGVFIDAANITTSFFVNKIGNGIYAGFGGNTMNAAKLVTNVGGSNPLAFMTKMIAQILFNLVSFCIYILYFLLLELRIVALYVLVILSPLAFVCSVFPFSKTFWTMWKSNFAQWCIIGIPAGFFLFLGSKMMTEMTVQKFTFDANVFSADALAELNKFGGIIVPVLFLLMGFMFTLKTSAIGASIITSKATPYAKKAVAWGAGASRDVGKKINDRMWNSPNRLLKTLAAPGKGVEYAAGGFRSLRKKAMEKAEQYNIIPPGTTAAGAEIKTGENRKRLEALYKKDPDAVARVAEQRAVTDKEKADKRVATEILAEERDLGRISTPAKRAEAVSHALTMGAPMKTFSKADPTMAPLDEKAVQKMMTVGDPERGIGPIANRAQAELRLIINASQKTDSSDFNKIESRLLNPVGNNNLSVLSGLNVGKVKSAAKSGNQAVISQLRKLKPGSPERAALLAHAAGPGHMTPSEITQLEAALDEIDDNDAFA